MAGFGFLELLTIIAIVSGGGLGAPIGLPPGERDPLLDQLQPESVLFSTTWAGTASPDPESKNYTERLMAEPEVTQFVAELLRTFNGAMSGGRISPETATTATKGKQLTTLLITRPGCLFIERFDPRLGPAGVQGMMAVNVGENAALVAQLLKDLIPIEGEEVEVMGTAFHKVTIPNAPPITWGIRGRYLMVGLGDGLKQAAANARSDAPKWLTDARQKYDLPRTASLTYVNVAAGRQLLTQVAPPEVGQFIQAFGLANVSHFFSVTGLDDTGYVNKTHLALNGPPQGILFAFDSPSLKQKDAAVLAADSLVSGILRLDAAKLFDASLEVLGQLDPRAVNETLSGLQELERELGVKLRDDVLAALGTSWTVQCSESAGGVVTGWLVSVDLRDYDRANRTFRQLRQLAEVVMSREAPAVQLRESNFAAETIYTINVAQEGFPVAPSFCLTESHFHVALYPQAIKELLSRKTGTASLADAPEVKEALAESPLVIGHVDTRKLWHSLYPFLQYGATMLSNAIAEEAEISVDLAALPSAYSVGQHLQPSVGTWSLKPDGFHGIRRQTFPGGDLGTTAPIAVALLLPAVKAAQEAAKRAQSTNNLRQLGLAMHIYHDAHRAMPPAYNADKQGKPLLSWRVHLLPYLEQQALYDQFHLDEPWDSEHNRKLIAKIPQTLQAPGSQAGPGKTNYLGIRGKGAVLSPPRKDQWANPPDQQRGARFADIVDGTSNTLMFVEVSDAKAVIWTKPDDFEYDPKQPQNGLIQLRNGGFLAAAADGSVSFISQVVDSETLLRLFQMNDGKAVDRRRF